MWMMMQMALPLLASRVHETVHLTLFYNRNSVVCSCCRAARRMTCARSKRACERCDAEHWPPPPPLPHNLKASGSVLHPVFHPHSYQRQAPLNFSSAIPPRRRSNRLRSSFVARVFYSKCPAAEAAREREKENTETETGIAAGSAVAAAAGLHTDTINTKRRIPNNSAAHATAIAIVTEIEKETKKKKEMGATGAEIVTTARTGAAAHPRKNLPPPHRPPMPPPQVAAHTAARVPPQL